jgi:hypothetical protein
MLFEEALNTTKVKSDKLGIPAGLTQEQFNQAIISYLETLNLASTVASAPSSAAASDITTNAGKNLVKTLYFDPSAADVKIELKDSTIDVTYDLGPLLKSIPKGAEIKKTSVILNGKRQVLANSDKSVMTVSAPPNEFPVTMDVTVKGATSEGEFLVKGSKELKAEDMSSVVHFTNNATQSIAVETQEDFNKKILEEVSYLKRMLS